MNYREAVFVKTSVSGSDYPRLLDDQGNPLPEIAVLGRSNVGKSSLLNHLFQRKGLVKASSKPGKTAALNFFSIENFCAFVDFPGYGFADVPLHVKKQWGPMVQSYLENRKELKLVLFLFDIRRTPNEEDLALVQWLLNEQVPTILVLTKSDKLNQSEKHQNTKKILEAFGFEKFSYLLYSVPKNRGRNTLMKLIEETL
ncbi:putative GTP-binding protein engB [Waddlia chondrophila 2032/99]|uniref:Probable GTP-binding protein EngB n=2 Tax=Waddlia chondrophila TaxID=71667 RepID=D6YSK3_WADCW|nr:ribosome biogenesis GTP-binding protein YihA/YsxC [Waddlia chondrophila]ADI39048.1 GTP-binding protein EngB [Waddlia chondrophila WSU 86-1044]CCB92160.1 putative GTP-binding protein engB [Waddlia chondrophila 2032/99]